jgi:hypothetical protein
MSAQFLLISVAVTCVSVALMFFYFKNRLGKTEQKVDLMFQLIQEHEKNSRYLQQNHQQMNTPNIEQQPELINISDDESVDDYASDDSAEVSDNEQEELVLKHDIENLEDTVKTISLSLNGAETSLNMETSELSHQDNADNTNEVVDDSNDENDNESDDAVDDANDESNDEKKEDELDIELDDDIDEQTIVDNTFTLDHFIITKKDVNDTNSDKSDEKVNNVESEDQQEEDNEDKKPSYTKLTKAQLKKIAEQRGLNGYNKLTKNGLVNLLAESD